MSRGKPENLREYAGKFRSLSVLFVAILGAVTLLYVNLRLPLALFVAIFFVTAFALAMGLAIIMVIIVRRRPR